MEINTSSTSWKTKPIIPLLQQGELDAEDMLLYIENPKDSTQKLLELINKFSKVAGCKINIQKSVAFLYINNEVSERECKQSLLKLQQKIKILWNKPHQGCERLIYRELQNINK